MPSSCRAPRRISLHVADVVLVAGATACGALLGQLVDGALDVAGREVEERRAAAVRLFVRLSPAGHGQAAQAGLALAISSTKTALFLNQQLVQHGNTPDKHSSSTSAGTAQQQVPQPDNSSCSSGPAIPTSSPAAPRHHNQHGERCGEQLAHQLAAGAATCVLNRDAHGAGRVRTGIRGWRCTRWSSTWPTTTPPSRPEPISPSTAGVALAGAAWPSAAGSTRSPSRSSTGCWRSTSASVVRLTHACRMLKAHPGRTWSTCPASSGSSRRPGPVSRRASSTFKGSPRGRAHEARRRTAVGVTVVPSGRDPDRIAESGPHRVRRLGRGVRARARNSSPSCCAMPPEEKAAAQIVAAIEKRRSRLFMRLTAIRSPTVRLVRLDAG